MTSSISSGSSNSSGSSGGWSLGSSIAELEQAGSSSAGSDAKKGGRGFGEAESYCTFRIDGRIYALPVEQVGEIISIDRLLPVPLAPSCLHGLFNLRGTPIAIVDLAQALNLGNGIDIAGKARMQGLVIRSGEVSAGCVIDSVLAVNRFADDDIKRNDSSSEHPAIRGIVSEAEGRPFVTVIDGEELHRRLQALQMQGPRQAAKE